MIKGKRGKRNQGGRGRGENGLKGREKKGIETHAFGARLSALEKNEEEKREKERRLLLREEIRSVILEQTPE